MNDNMDDVDKFVVMHWQVPEGYFRPMSKLPPVDFRNFGDARPRLGTIDDYEANWS